MKTKNKNKERLKLDKKYITSLDAQKVTGGRAELTIRMEECDTPDEYTRLRCPHTGGYCELDT